MAVLTGGDRERQRQAFLADAIEVLNRSLDYEQTLAALAWIAVPTIADWCAVDMVEGGALRRLAAAHVDPAKIQLVAELEGLGANRRAPQRRVLESGKPELLQITPEMIEQGAEEALKERVRALALRSFLVVPLHRGAQRVGTITLATAESGRTFDDSDVALAMQLADRASVAIAHAHLYRELEHSMRATAGERDRLIQLVADAPLAIAIMRGQALEFVVANSEFERIFGGRKLVGMTQRDLDPQGLRTPGFLRTLTEGEHAADRELPVSYDWDGTGLVTTRYFTTSRAPLRDIDGTIDSVVSFSLDVTEQVLARRRIDDARHQAELGSRAKDEFLAMLGHELRNPLAPILTALELMELRAPDQHQRERSVIQRQVQHMIRLVDDLLDIARITRGAVELHRETVDLADIVAKAIEQASPLLEEKKHELRVTSPRGITVHGDPVRLAQVVTNLVTNAAKYTKAGGLVEITLRRDGDDAELRVRDTGVGIAPDVLPRVFETFYQVRQSIERARGGLGLGLAIVKSLVRAHGGEVSATSAGLGAGSEFVVRLPASARAAPRATGTPVSGTRPLRPEKLLLVDDNHDAILLLADALADRGFHTLVAHDAPSALALADSATPTIALLDIGLPVVDGYELGRQLHARVPAMQLVAITGYGQANDFARSREAGFAAHLVKPFAVDEVLAVIERLLERLRTGAMPVG